MHIFQKLSPLYLTAGLSLLLGVSVAACDDDDDPVQAVPDAGGMGGAGGSDAGDDAAAGSGGAAEGGAGEGGAGPGTQAMVRVVHASPTAPAVDLYVKGNTTPVASAIEYGKATPYLELPAGTYDLELREAGAPASDPAAFEVMGLAVTGGAKYTAIAAGDLAASDDTDKFRVLALQEEFDAPGAGNVRVRIVHAGIDAPTVDIDVGNDDPANAEVKGIARFADTGPSGLELPAGQALQVGLAAESNTVTAFTSPELPAGLSAFVIATGQLGLSPRDDKGFGLLAVLPDSSTVWIEQNPFVYALHASPDAPAVDIYAGDKELYDNVAFGEMGRVQVPPGTHTLEFFAGEAGATPKPSNMAAATATTPALEAGETYLAIAAGLLTQTNASGFQLIALGEQFRQPDMGTSRVRVVHAAPDAPSVDIGPAATEDRLAANPPIQALTFGSASEPEGLALPVGDLTLGLAPAGSLQTVQQYTLSIPDQGRLYAVAAGMLSPEDNQPPLQLLIVNATATSILETWSVSPVQ